MEELTKEWSFLSNHSLVLICIAKNPDVKTKEIAELVGITERRVYKILSDLDEAGVIEREKEGRRNHFIIHSEIHLRHPLEQDHEIGDLFKGILTSKERKNLNK